MRRAHFIAGLIFFVIFLLTGVYLRQHMTDLFEGHDRPVTLIGMILALTGVAAHLYAGSRTSTLRQ